MALTSPLRDNSTVASRTGTGGHYCGDLSTNERDGFLHKVIQSDCGAEIHGKALVNAEFVTGPQILADPTLTGIEPLDVQVWRVMHASL